MKDTIYYDTESAKYSAKRYPQETGDYVHHLFKTRLSLLLALLRSPKINKTEGNFLEIGCADGVVLSTISKEFPKIRALMGVDISPGMIEAARHAHTSEKIHFSLRDDSQLKDKSVDVVIEVGVLNLTDLFHELTLVKRVLKDGGYYICSIASHTSLVSLLKPSTSSDYRHHLTYKEYESEFEKSFIIEKAVPYGLFIPHIWKVPALARVLQPFAECICRKVTPSLFHEKIYLLKAR